MLGAMHDPSCEGNDFFKCDFCRAGWREDLPMVEGHEGSLVCASCLSVAYLEVVVQEMPNAPAGVKCTMCLEHRKDPCWQSPAHDGAVICLRCIKQAATGLEKDPEYGWRRPSG